MRPYLLAASRSVSERRWRGSAMAVVVLIREGENRVCRGGGARGSSRPPLCLWRGVLADVRLDLLGVRRLSVLDDVQAVVRQRRVAVGIDRVGAEHALAILRRQQRRGDRLAVVGLVTGALERVEGEGHRLVAVDRVRIDGLRLVLGLVLLEDRRGARQVLRAQRRDRRLRASADAGGNAALLRVGERLLGDAVGAVELHGLVGGGDVLVDLDAVLTGDAGPHEAVGLDLRRDRAVVRRVLVGALLVLDRQAACLGGLLDVASQTGAVHGLVVPQRGGLAAVLLHDADQRGALDLVARHDAGVRALAGRVVLVRLAGLGAGLVRRQTDVRVRRADLRDAGLVEDRQRDLRST